MRLPARPRLSGLFWKLFAGFWLTLIAAGLAVGTAVWLYYQQRAPDADAALAAGPRAEFLVRSAAATLRHGGEPALRALLEGASEDSPAARVHAVDDEGRELLGRAVSPEALARARARLSRPDDARPMRHPARGVRLVVSPEGRRLLLFVPAAEAVAGPGGEAPRQGRRAPPPPGLGIAIGLLASLAFSAMLAAYLVRPIRHLRRAFADAADGRLETRVAGLMGRRRDEIAGLGEDFDRMAERLQKLIVSQRRLLHDVSHELRSPLARLQAAIGLARQNPARTAAMLDRIERDTQRLDALVGELLTLARLEANAADAPRQTVDLGELLREIVDDARFEAQAAGREVRLAAPGEAILVPKGHPGWLQRAFENVIRNALRHTAEGTAVEVGLRTAGDAVSVTVSDRGPGLPADQLEAVFEPFHRGPAAGGDGHGLGLAIARRALAAHGGTIVAASRDGGGLTMTMTLPRLSP
ncbi:ATP-binding protein [Burkholderiaceae bacterium FT117]|uniref:ATP-binding protein n=1 Tax=Zeimonas sediminis TaxID=2944268 RepID=UPI002342CAD5|nr:ATP-binding protein [Zeimonas sediminis]MCM5571429.1 ATP-binding protein [Zeimonas sediminis]